ncbi:MAG: hypothetical protein JO340_18620 [Acidobacteriaceae bacterium]|nr:hypothetical protein [Acidobacteriaceae bacterium]
MNSLTHGCRSAKTVLPDEDPAEFDFTVQSWMDSYKPQDPTTATLVFETARAQWVFQRNQHRLDEIESRLPADAWHWSDSHQKLYQNFSRYKTTAERTFYRAFHSLEAHCGRLASRAARAEKAQLEIARIQMEWLKKKAEKAAADRCARQWVQVYANAQGECITSCAPTNEQLAERAAAAKSPPQFVTRFVSFLNGVPPAYQWACPNDVQRFDPTTGLQAFVFSDWLEQVAAEKALATGHLAPFAISLLDDSD